jgi:hypothetical protein
MLWVEGSDSEFVVERERRIDNDLRSHGNDSCFEATELRTELEFD